ncbi:hypothetical protein SGGMMB4_04956 [Sodalis glossinidius str. 'morsitans']|uniref:Type III secretion apparatus n=1 Tax=Sodalis glossinidius (strain morsitans) TaxID=343509 RepID=A0A193QMJ3_SODGM|nr:hypothetical protein [Sodalis glossinidius]CRL46377.1 hypothetical protein SGGMMB4_04956 [Sodalis glossinidius str. 'morsitans']
MHISLSPLERGAPLSHLPALSAQQGGMQSLDEKIMHALADGVAQGHHARAEFLRPPSSLSLRPGGLSNMLQQQIKGMKYAVSTSLTATLVNKLTLAVKTVLGA